jgi:hypothetical protein
VTLRSRDGCDPIIYRILDTIVGAEKDVKLLTGIIDYSDLSRGCGRDPAETGQKVSQLAHDDDEFFTRATLHPNAPVSIIFWMCIHERHSLSLIQLTLTNLLFAEFTRIFYENYSNRMPNDDAFKLDFYRSI